MKKFVFFAIFCFILTGCSYNSSSKLKVLECSSSNMIGSATNSNQKYKISFIDDRVSNLLVDINISLNEQDDVTRDNIENDVNSALDFYKNSHGISYSSNINDNGFDVNIDIDFNKLSDEEKLNVSFINYKMSYDEIMEELVNNGFLCQ